MLNSIKKFFNKIVDTIKCRSSCCCGGGIMDKQELNIEIEKLVIEIMRNNSNPNISDV